MKKTLFILVIVFILSGFKTLNASLITRPITWTELNIDVVVTYPDKVTYGNPFDIGFFINSAEMPSYGMMAFIPKFWVSNTVDISGVTWSEDYDSNDTTGTLPFHTDSNGLDYTGQLGDQYSPYSYDSISDGYKITLFDPFFSLAYGSKYTWLDKSYEDRVTWALHNFIIRSDTDFNIELNAEVWLDNNFQSNNMTVFDPPQNIPLNNSVPEPGSFTFAVFCIVSFLGYRFTKRN